MALKENGVLNQQCKFLILSKFLILRLFFYFSLICSGTFINFDLSAQSTQAADMLQSSGKISILTNRISASELPAPGLPLELKAELQNTRDFRQPLKILLVRDQQFQEFVSEPGLPDSREKPQYSISIPAPLVELEYQFVLNMPDGSIITSLKNKVRRNCLPDTTPAVEKIELNMDDKEKFDLLVAQNALIEGEIANFESAVRELKLLSSMLTK